jgi:acetyltransferase AlgX (SGNH hydrolase-like protein)
MNQSTSVTPSPLPERLGPRVFVTGLAILWAYLSAAFLFETTLGSMRIGMVGLLGLFGVGMAVIAAMPRAPLATRVIPPASMFAIGLACIGLTVALLFADFALKVRDNVANSRAEESINVEGRTTDATIWHGELYPRQYAPTNRNFRLYKPNVRVTGETYGERYVSSMLKSPTLVAQVLEKRSLSYFIGPDGLRELEPLADSHIFALGDSFVFGFATDEGKTWTDLLGKSMGVPIYNLGVSATGPRPQLELFKYLLEKNTSTMHVQRLLWMIFEGNDLENSYDTFLSDAPAAAASPFEGTLVEPFLSIPERVKGASVLRRLVRGQLTLSSGGPRYGQNEIDGQALPLPLFHSKQFGYRFFVPADVDAATRPMDYVLNHPNRPLLDQTFQEMRTLSQKAHFDVTVIIAPSDARLYGKAFEGFPTLSAKPYFVDYVAELSQHMGFSVVNLLDLLQPAAQTELLYYRDDHHWNERGNELVSQLIAQELTRH